MTIYVFNFLTLKNHKMFFNLELYVYLVIIIWLLGHQLDVGGVGPSHV